MKMFKKLVALATLTAMMGTSAHSLNAQVYSNTPADCCGYGYQDSCKVPCYAPAIALGTIALVAIIAVVLENHHHHHGHSHSHD